MLVASGVLGLAPGLVIYGTVAWPQMTSQVWPISRPTTTRVERARNALVATLYKQQLGTAIRRRREVLGLTQRQLADRLHLSEAQTVSRWERGDRAPADLDAVANALETTTEILLADLEPIGQRQRRAMSSNGLTQLDRIENKIDALFVEVRERDDRLEAQERAITELRAALVGDVGEDLQRNREQASPAQRDTGR